MAFILFDTETTGNTETDRICQIAIGILGAEGTEYICEYCKPDVPISFHAMAVHGITPEKIIDKPPFDRLHSAHVLKSLNNQNNTIIAHNASFDIDMLKKEGIEWRGDIIDTLRCAKHLLPDEDSHALQYLRYSTGIYKEEGCTEEQNLRVKFDTFSAHDALFDIYILKKLFKKLFMLAGSSQRMIELTSSPVTLKRIKFGKYKEKSFEEIAKLDIGYMRWLAQNSENEDVRYTASLFI